MNWRGLRSLRVLGTRSRCTGCRGSTLSNAQARFGDQCDDLMLDTSASRVTAHGPLLNLRGVEYRILEFLMSHPGKTFNRTQILKQIWGSDGGVDERTIDVNVQ